MILYFSYKVRHKPIPETKLELIRKYDQFVEFLKGLHCIGNIISFGLNGQYMNIQCAIFHEVAELFEINDRLKAKRVAKYMMICDGLP
jgi:hypothetical protein